MSRRYPEVAAEIKTWLNRTKVSIGDKLPPERELAERFSVSRSLLREALIMLEIEGLVVIKKGSGIYLNESPLQQNQGSEAGEIGPFELLQARQVLESTIAGVAALYVTKAEIESMQEVLDQERDAAENGILEYDNDERFHLAIANASQNRALAESVQQLWQLRERSTMWAKLHTHIIDSSYRLRWLDDHQEILNTLKRRRPELSRQAMWNHLRNVREAVFDLSNVDDPRFDGYLFDGEADMGVLFELQAKEVS